MNIGWDDSVEDARGVKRRYIYESHNEIYAFSWSSRRDKRYRFAIGSYLQTLKNKIMIVRANEEGSKIKWNTTHEFLHRYPPSKIMFIPDEECHFTDVLASSSDILRIWRVHEEKINVEREFSSNHKKESVSPLTSFDWNNWDPNRIGTSSIDATCTIWDIELGKPVLNFSAHDKEIYDIVWGGPNLFATASSDSSLRVCDLRDKETVTTIYKSPGPKSIGQLAHLSWNHYNPNYMIASKKNSTRVMVFDLRYPVLPRCRDCHHDTVTSLSWAPNSSRYFCTAGNDSQLLLWNWTSGSIETYQRTLDPVLVYSACYPINQVRWSSVDPSWLAVSFNKGIELLSI